MNLLNAQIGEHTKQFQVEESSLKELREQAKVPLEIVAFGQEFFISLMGATHDVRFEIISAEGKQLDLDEYKIRL